MNILVIGCTGRVGSALISVLGSGHKVSTLNRLDCDLEDGIRLARMIKLRRADVVINATAMNGMEACDADPMLALEINAMAPAIMAGACKAIGAFFIHFSTDYVFSGNEMGLFETTPTRPSGIYGMSKLKGEELVKIVGGNYCIFRLSSVYGRQWGGPVDPVNQVLQGKGVPGNPIKVLRQFCAPTSARAISNAVKHVIENTVHSDVTGLYHLATSIGVWKNVFAHHITKKVFGREFVIEEGTLAVPRPVHTKLEIKAFEDKFDYKLPDYVADFDDMLKFMPKVSILVS